MLPYKPAGSWRGDRTAVQAAALPSLYLCDNPASPDDIRGRGVN